MEKFRMVNIGKNAPLFLIKIDIQMTSVMPIVVFKLTFTVAYESIVFYCLSEIIINFFVLL